ncbi:hypothetical protein JA1_003858 [Spathaspora sp. JA1]|nr:hypothetical protein JA1_003858 [Spathaspora sp. JA1]
MPKNTLYVTGFSRESKAADLAPDFEKFGELVRLDIPPPRTDDGQKYAFVEYKDAESCEKALELDGKTLPYSIKDGLVVQIARSDPYNTRPRGGFRGGRGGFGYSGGAPRGGYRGGYDRGYGSGGYGGDDDRYSHRGPPRGGFRGDNGYRGGYGGYHGEDRGYGSGPSGRGGYGGYRGDDRSYRGGRGGYGGDREFRSRGPTYDNRGDRYREEREARGDDRRGSEGGRGGDDYGRGKYSRSPSRSPPRRERSRSPERY